ncbi:succinate dehydrogenase, hydrophobic membrane anchor protein [Massilia sp. W12]|uniref:succinate dehydrogenase, hydrophobic membrane anchor protein n=1 Tax=Massilia sp. W12 TaxID=3126507 RepID=UPI0030D2361E
MAQDNIGPKRLVVGAGYGLRDWLAQRLTAFIMALYTLILLFNVLTAKSFGYHGWAGLFAQQWFKLISFVTFCALLYHVWVGVRDIWMDYVKPVGARLFLHMFTIVWLVACAGWMIQILWRV